MLYKRVLCIAFGSVLALSMCPVLISPLDVSADAGEFSGAVDYISSFSSTEILEIPGGAAVYGIVMGLNMVLSHPIEAGGHLSTDGLTCIQGTYRVPAIDDQPHIGVICFGSVDTSFDSSFTVFQSDLYSLDFYQTSGNPITWSFSVPPSNFSTFISYVNTNSGTSAATGIRSIPDGFHANVSGFYRYGLAFTTGSVTYPGDPPYTRVRTGISWSDSLALIGNSSFVSLPPGEFTPTTINSFWSETVYPYISETYPEAVFLVTDPDLPDLPDYPDPSDFYPGIPKDWTITNPDLPSIPDLDLQLPTADFDDLDPVEPITSNLSGVSFWWDLLETILDLVDVKAFWIAIAAIGLAVFVLWKLGG